MSGTATAKTNRTVEALVRPERSGEGELLLRMFNQRGWVASKVGRDQYRVAVPLYCARTVAVRACQQELGAFSRAMMPLIIDEVRLREVKAKETRRRARAVPRNLGWLDRAWFYLRGGEQWEVSLPRSTADTAQRRLADEEKRAEQCFGRSPLAGHPPERGVRPLLFTEPARVYPENMSAARMTGFVAGYIIGAVVWLASALAIGFPGLPVGWKILAGSLGASLSIWVALWATGSHIGRWQRRAAPVVAIVLFGLWAYALSRAWIPGVLDISEMWRSIGQAFGLLVGGLFLIRGWTHLMILSPGARTLWSFPAFSSLIAASAAAGAFLLWSVLSALGVQRSDLAESATASALLALFVGALVAGGVVAVGALRGWANYFRLFATRGLEADFLKFIVGLFVAFTVFIFLLGLGGRLTAAVGEQLNGGEGVIFDLGLADRRCASALIERKGQVILGEGEEVSVIRGSGGQVQWWMSSDMVEEGQSHGEFVPVGSVASAQVLFPADGACSE